MSDTDQTIPTDDNQQPQGDDNQQDLQAQLDRMTATAQRALADLQNIQRRATEERISLYPQAQADLMIQFLPVIDNFARAFSAIPADLQSHEWVNGVSQIEKQFIDILSKTGLTEINPENQPFDPNQHEAMMEVEGPSGQIVQVLEKGYMFQERVIRPAKVSVGK